MDNKTIVRRIPNELDDRVQEFKKNLGDKGVIISDIDAYRTFAKMAVTPNDEVLKALKRLGEYKLIK